MAGLQAGNVNATLKIVNKMISLRQLKEIHVSIVFNNKILSKMMFLMMDLMISRLGMFHIMKKIRTC